jgi:PAS domain S-box-containing protein
LGGINVKSSYNNFKEIFNKSLVGILFYDKEGKLVDANPSALEIAGIPEDIPEVNLFDSFPTFSREKLLKDKVIKFQASLNFENIKNTGLYTPTRSGTAFIDLIVSDIGSGFLVQIQDIKDCKSEEPLQSEEKYRRFFEEDLTGDFIATPEGKILECNPAFAEIYGFDNCKQAVQSKISTFNPEDWKNLINRLEMDHKVQGHQTIHKRLDGEEINVVANVIAVFNKSKQLIQIKGYIFDDTERKKAEEALKESEEKYHRFFDEDLTGDFIAKPEGKIIECNPSFAEIYGFDSREKAVKSDISKFNLEDWINLVTLLKTERKIHDYQSWHKRPDGNEIHVVANVVGIFNESDELIQVKGYVFDDTERKKAEEALKKSEEKYHRLFYEDLTGDFIATPEGKILECNPAFAGIYGFDNCKMALQWNISESNPFDWPYMVTRLKNKRKIQGYQSWQRRSDGLRIHVVANVVGIFNESDELIQVKGYVFDDTERKHSEEELTNNKRRITDILDSIQDGFIALNHYWNFIYVNQCAAEYAGAEVDDLMGQNLWERFPELKGTIYETAFRKAMEKQKIIHFEVSGLHTSDRWFEFSVYPSDEGISIYWRDITSRK